MTTSEITVKRIFKTIRTLNPIVHNYGKGRVIVEDQGSTDEARRIMPYLGEGSLAKKIVSTSSRFSEKQLWVVAYELMKSEEYKQMLIAEWTELYGGDDFDDDEIDYLYY